MPGTKVPHPILQPPPRWRAARLAAIALAAISIAGCANSSPGRSPATPGPLSYRALAAKADAICERLREALNAADAEAGWSTLRSRAKLSVLFGSAEKRASDQLAELKPHASALPEWQRIVASRRGLVPYHRRITKYALRGDAAKVEATYSAYKKAQRRMQLAFKHSRFGFKICWDIG
jgi:hypothetical protein